MGKLKPPVGLRQNIISGIGQVERRRAKVYFFVSAGALPFSVIGVVFSGKYLLQGFYQSGFYHYLSLALTWDSAVFGYWKELSYSLVETMPILWTIFFVSAVGFFVWSGAGTVSGARRFALSA